jgi:hypothetical protein
VSLDDDITHFLIGYGSLFPHGFIPNPLDVANIHDDIILDVFLCLFEPT